MMALNQHTLRADVEHRAIEHVHIQYRRAIISYLSRILINAISQPTVTVRNNHRSEAQCIVHAACMHLDDKRGILEWSPTCQGPGTFTASLDDTHERRKGTQTHPEHPTSDGLSRSIVRYSDTPLQSEDKAPNLENVG